MKRKLLSLAIAFALLSQTMVSAGALYTHLNSFFALPLTSSDTITATVKGEVKGAGESYSLSTNAQNFDYRASIDMSAVRAAFTERYTVGQAMCSTPILLTQFDNSHVTGTFTITFDYADGITQTDSTVTKLADLQLPTSSIFKIVSAPANDTTAHKVTVTAKVKGTETGDTPLTVGDLNTNLTTYLGDFDLELKGLSATTPSSTITVSMTGFTDISEDDTTALLKYGVINYNSNSAIATVYVPSGPHIGGSGSTTNAPTANFISDGVPTNIKVEKSGSDYYVSESDLPDEDESGATIYGWYLDEDMTIPVTVDKNGRIKISGNTSFYYRTVPIANTVVNNVTDPVTVESSDDGTFTVDMADLPAQDGNGHTIYGWDLDEEHTIPAIADANGILKITSDTFLYPRTKPIAATIVNGLTTSLPVLTSDDETFTIDVAQIENPSKEGFAFLGWYTEPNFINPISGVATITKDTYLYPRYINITAPEQMISEEHILYVYGYPDGEVKPNGYITREEVAAIFCRLLKPEYRATIETDENSFPDVESGRWSNREISTMANGGYIVGDENGYFNPANPITRAEFTVIASKFAGIDTVPAENNFTDIDGHWAKDYILKAAGQYWITGYEDLTFRPQNKITRAEAMTIVNTMLVRYGDHDSEYAKQWPDVKKTDWYYDQVIEATSHNYFTRNEDGWSETWIYADEDNNSHAR